ncbi:MAG TPA: molybdopterin-dependent oxidoreductase, partial [Solirubrobacterales bacterium]|nr:molybdopterin-dependent oxidoreductase [Solirubrobacterales bacterium]
AASEKAAEGQNATLEFILVNHPLDCPVCDKGGECPLQDITQGWGPGKSRVIDEKRHFPKPIELSPLVAIDRERCILCYRCVRFSQEVAEDEQLQLLERGDRTYVGTFDERPYVSPFHGNITDICPVGALTNYTYRFRARPWDIEQGGTVCTLCPSQCNVSLTIRDEKVKRVLTRDNHDVDDGWICDKGRYGFEMFAAEERVTGPRLKGGEEVAWEAAIAAAANGLRGAGPGKVAAIVGDASNEEAFLLQELLRGALGSPHLDSRAYPGPDRDTLLALSRPELSAKVKDIDSADAILVLGTDPLHSSPILDLRVRKAIRRGGARLVVATERPTALDGGAEAIARYAPGEAGHFIGELTKAIGGKETVATPLAETLREAGKVVVLWGQRIDRDSATASAALLDLANRLEIAGTDGSGLLEIPDFTNARGLREAGALPDAGPGLGETTRGYDVEQIRTALEQGDLTGLILFGVDPLRDFADTTAWETAITAADFVVSFSMHENATTAKSNVVFPLETHAEKDGTVTHPDGRLQRIRPAASRPEGVRSNIQVLSELSAALGQPTEISNQPTAFAALTKGVAFYSGITDQDLGGTGFRWQEGPSAGQLPSSTSAGAASQSSPGVGVPSPGTPAKQPGEGTPATGLLLGTYRDIWAGPVTELNPPLRFLQPKQRLELSEPDAERLNLKTGYEVRVTAGDQSVDAIVQIKERVPEGVCFLSEGIPDANANALRNGGPVRVTVSQPETIEV